MKIINNRNNKYRDSELDELKNKILLTVTTS